MTKADVEKNDPLTLLIDYGSGVQKRFAQIPYQPPPFSHSDNLGVTDVLDLAQSIGPLRYTFASRGFDRGGREMGMIDSIDGIQNESSAKSWVVLVNQEPVGELRRVNSASVMKTSDPIVEPGAEITLLFQTND